ncbi:phosphatidylinositol 4,5-bisphosphate 3-kinase catalytic subunit gamma isoform-like [Sycon ciliatum]|uniref:phosphatidylinositol 4,5-bisphosphate 3-kinase catalytic subunit gamma isoform-like n=1 Tax=Sycon ciliatum TaxID=27933 RepID=UPI0031F6B747
MAAMVNGTESLPRNFRNRAGSEKKKGGLFSSFRKKKANRQPIPSQFVTEEQKNEEDNFAINKLAMDDFECDYRENGHEGKPESKASVSGEESPLTLRDSSQPDLKYAVVSGAALPQRLVPRRDADVFKPGDRSPRRSFLPRPSSSVSLSHSMLDTSSIASSPGSDGSSQVGSHSTVLFSPPPGVLDAEQGDSGDSITPTQDLVNNSSFIEYERHLFVKSAVQSAWSMEDPLNVCMPKFVDDLEAPSPHPEPVMSEGEVSSVGELTADERSPLSSEYGSPLQQHSELADNKVINNYRDAKRLSGLCRSPSATPVDSEEEHGSPQVLSPHASLPCQSIAEQAEDATQHQRKSYDHLAQNVSLSAPNSPSLMQRRRQSLNSPRHGRMGRSVHSRPHLLGPNHHLSTGSLSSASSAASIGSVESVELTPSRYTNGHRPVARLSGSIAQRRVSTSDIASLGSDAGSGSPFRARSQTTGFKTKLEVSISDSAATRTAGRSAPMSYGNIVKRGGHVRVKSMTKMNLAGDGSDASVPARPRNRCSVPTSPFSPLLSPSPQSKFVLNPSTRSSSIHVEPFSPTFWTLEFSVEKRDIEFVLPIKSLIRMPVSGGKSISQVKSMLWSKMSDEGLLISYQNLKDMSHYSFKYYYNNDKYELFDELQMMQTLHIWQTWKKHGMRVGTLIVELRREPKAKEKRLVHTISHLIGGGLTQYLQRSTPEIDWTRRSLVGVRLAAVRQRDKREYSMEAEVTTNPIPSHIKEIFASGSGMLNLEVFFMQEPGSKTIEVPISFKPTEIMNDIFHYFKTEAAAHDASSSASDYVLRVCGQRVFIHGDHLFVNFIYVRECLSKHLPIKLALVPVLDAENDEPESFGDEEFVDEMCGVSANHYQLTMLNKPHGEVFNMSMWDIGQNFRIRVLGLSRLTPGVLGRGERIGSVYVEAGIYHGGRSLVAHQRTSELPYRTNPNWYQWVEFDLPTRHLPKAARICFSVMMTVVSNRGRQVRGPVPMYWVNMNVINHRSLLQQGNVALSMWPCSSTSRESSILSADTFTDGGAPGELEESNRNSIMAIDGSEASVCGMQPAGSSAVNSQSFDCPTLTVELDSYAHPVACPNSGWPCTLPQSPSEPPPGSIEQLEKVTSSSTFVEMSDEEKKLVFHHREFLSKNPKALVKFLGSIDWADLQQVQEAHRLIAKWTKISPEDALELLDFQFADKVVRTVAVSCLESLSNMQLVAYLLQLVQVLKFEAYHDNALARFLLKRALSSKHIGHFFFWYLRAEMDRPDFRQRYSLLLEAYLRGCGKSMLAQFQKQNAAMIGLNEVARRVKFAESRNEHGPPLSQLLTEADLPRGFAPAFNCSIILGKLDVDACKVMSSKKKPLWLEFLTEEAARGCRQIKQVIFKQGDDLRQDMLTLQVLRLMDLLWQNDGLDLYMIPYGCVATGLNSGMIEVVGNAQTIAKIQQEEGGGILLPKGFAPFKKETVFNWLKKMNPSQEDLDKAVEKFTLSCAGYCVATYVLGIGDRHNDNIMLTRDGNLFHIDFGHFLGNIKYFNVLGKKVKRERLPFILTPDFIYVMNSNKENELFPLFQRTCARAFNILRRHANVLINLFAMMKLTGIPELRGTEDLSYLHQVLRPESTDTEAERWFSSLIEECRANSDSVQANWALHIIGQQLAAKT